MSLLGRSCGPRTSTPSSTRTTQAPTGPETGLSKRLTARDLTGFGIGIVIGTGIFTLTGVEAKHHAGPAIVISFAIAGVVSMLAALCYAELAAAVPTAGSSYTYAYTTIGEIFAWIIAWDLILEFALGAAVVSRGWSAYLKDALGLPAGLFGESAPVNVGAVLIAAVLGVVAAVGIRESKWLTNALVVTKVAVCLFVVVAGLFFLKTANWLPFVPPSRPASASSGAPSGLAQPLWQWVSGVQPSAFGFAGVLVAAGVVFFAYSGFEAVANLGEETENPGRDMPRGLIGTLVVCTVLYLLVCLVLTGMVSYADLDEGAPISDAFHQVGLGLGRLPDRAGRGRGPQLGDPRRHRRDGPDRVRAVARRPAAGVVREDPPEVPHPDPDHGRDDRRGLPARGVRAAGHAGRDGLDRDAVRLRRGLDRGGGAAPHRAADAPAVPDPAGPAAADRLGAGVRRADGEPGRRHLDPVPGLAGDRPGRLLRLRPPALGAGSHRGRRGDGGRAAGLTATPRGLVPNHATLTPRYAVLVPKPRGVGTRLSPRSRPRAARPARRCRRAACS